MEQIDEFFGDDLEWCLFVMEWSFAPIWGLQRRGGALQRAGSGSDISFFEVVTGIVVLKWMMQQMQYLFGNIDSSLTTHLSSQWMAQWEISQDFRTGSNYRNISTFKLLIKLLHSKYLSRWESVSSGRHENFCFDVPRRHQGCETGWKALNGLNGSRFFLEKKTSIHPIWSSKGGV